MIASVFNQHKDKLCYHVVVNSGKRKSTCYFRSEALLKVNIWVLLFFFNIGKFAKGYHFMTWSPRNSQTTGPFHFNVSSFIGDISFFFFQAECVVIVGVNMQILEDTIYSHN